MVSQMLGDRAANICLKCYIPVTQLFTGCGLECHTTGNDIALPLQQHQSVPFHPLKRRAALIFAICKFCVNFFIFKFLSFFLYPAVLLPPDLYFLSLFKWVSIEVMEDYFHIMVLSISLQLRE